MSFTTPAAFWLLLLLPIPLLLKWRRPPVPRHAVSNLFLWRAAAGRVDAGLTFHRVPQSWMVAAQMAIIGAIVIALANPVVALNVGRAAFVFDVSASMAARADGMTRFDAARASARGMLETLSPSARVELILAAASPRELGTWTAADPRLASAIDALAPTAGRADLPAALDVATRGGNVVVVFSDAEPARPIAGGPDVTQMQWIRVGGVVDNSAVTRVSVLPATLGGRSGLVFVVLRHFGAMPREAELQISTDGRVVHRAYVRLDAAAPYPLQVPLVDLGSVVTVRLVGEDALSFDDTRSAVVPRARPTHVALFGARGSFLERALLVNPSLAVRTYDERVTAAEMAAAISGDGAEVAVCDRCAAGETLPVPVLYVSGGGDSIRGPLTPAIPFHPVISFLEFTREVVTVSTAVAAKAGADVILRVGGVPAITASDNGERRAVDVRLDLSQPDFVLSPAFPIFVANALAWLTAPRDVAVDTTSGDPIVVAASAAQQSGLRIVGPDGHPRTGSSVGGNVIVTDTDMTGAYRIELNGAARLVVVNPAVDGESDLRRTKAATLDGNETPGRKRLDASTEIRGWLALAGFALLVLEWRYRMAGPS